MFVSDRSATTLLPLIERVIRPGSIFHSDQEVAFRGIATIPVNPILVHRTFNHSENFVDLVSGVHMEEREKMF